MVKFADTEEERTQRKQKQQRRRMGQVARYGHYIEGAPPAFAVSYPAQMPPGAFAPPFAAPVPFFPFPAPPFAHDGHAPHPHSHTHAHAPVYVPTSAPQPVAPPVSASTSATATTTTAATTAAATAAGAGAIPADCNLFVYNLPENADDALLVRLFSPYGSVVSVRVQRDKLTHAPKGYGFVQMASPGEALAALQALNGAKLGDKILSVSFKK